MCRLCVSCVTHSIPAHDHQGYSHRQGGVRIFDARVKILLQGHHDAQWRGSKNGPVCFWSCVKILTPRHLCENPYWVLPLWTSMGDACLCMTNERCVSVHNPMGAASHCVRWVPVALHR